MKYLPSVTGCLKVRQEGGEVEEEEVEEEEGEEVEVEEVEHHKFVRSFPIISPPSRIHHLCPTF